MPLRAPKTPSTPGPSHSAAHGHGAATPVPDEPPPVSAGGTYTLEEVAVGCKIFVQKPDMATAEMEERMAEILSIREKPKPKRKVGEKDTSDALPISERLEYYVHYSEFNKRLDEWVPAKRLVLSRHLTFPAPPPQAVPGQQGTNRKKSVQQRSSLPSTPSAGLTTPTTGGRTTSSVNLLKQAALAAAQSAGDAASQAREGSQPLAGQKRRAGSHDSDDAGSVPATPSTPQADVEMSDSEAGPSGGGVAGEGDAVVSMEVVAGQDGEGEDAGPQDVLAADGTSLDPNARKKAPISKEAEIEKLRTSGSMTQSSHEVSRVKNLNKIQMGAHEIETWYFSPYPVEYAYVDMLYICEMCLSYFPSDFMLRRHRQKCGLVHPPGNEIYRHEDISFFEIDGRRQKTWCRNLCLLSKCFLDHKTLYYDVDPFLYYVMAQRDDAGVHIIGYFSKEKESAENYNVACILTLPQHQRSGFGRLLIEFSYELTKREHKLGSPEKPLSDLGLLGYRAYWAETIVELLLRTEEDISIEEISNRTAVIPSDVLHTCTALNMLKHYQGKHYLVLNDTVLQQHEKQMKKKRRRIVPEKLNWDPPKFTREQLRFGW